MSGLAKMPCGCCCGTTRLAFAELVLDDEPANLKRRRPLPTPRSAVTIALLPPAKCQVGPQFGDLPPDQLVPKHSGGTIEMGNVSPQVPHGLLGFLINNGMRRHVPLQHVFAALEKGA